MTKADIRTDMKLQRNNIPEEKRKEWDAAINQQLLQTEEYRLSKKFFCYVSFGTELDTKPIILQALCEDKEVYVPKVEPNHRMEFYRISHLEGLQPSRFGVPEPLTDEELRYRPEALRQDNSYMLMILPGLAFDPFGNRIGYGAGYYDRYLLQNHARNFYKIALCYDFQLIQRIETQEYDIGADAIITPTKQIICNSYGFGIS